MKMQFSKWILGLILLEEIACGIFIQEGCVSDQEKVTTLRGTRIPITVWVPPSNGDEVFLTLASTEEDIYFHRRVEIRPSSVHVNETRGGHDKHESSEVPEGVVRPGWMDFTVTLDSRFRVMVGNLTIVDVEGVPSSTIAIKGSNVTAGCTEPIIVWEVNKGSEAAIPALGQEPQKFSIFSKTASLPQLKLGHNDVNIGWDTLTKSVITLTSAPRPLPAFLLHNFTVECRPRDELTMCDILAAHTLVGSALLSEEPTSLSFRANEKDNYMVILQRHTTTEEEEYEEIQCPEVMPEDQSRGWRVGTIVCASLSSVLLIAVIALVVMLVKEKRDSFDSPPVFRKAPQNRADERERKQSPKIMGSPC